MVFFLQILIAHLLGDFVFQPQKWVKDKEQNKIKSAYLYAHILVHIVCLLVLIQFNPKYTLGVFLIIFSHFLIDICKVYIQKPKTKRTLFFIDQLLHILVLVFVTFMYYPFEIDFSAVFSKNGLLLIASLIMITFASSVIIGTLISIWTPETNAKGEEKSLKKAGKYIGILERLFVFMFVILGRWEGIGFLITAKSVFRFSDLKSRKLTEYILIGTLLSFGLAIITGLIYTYFTNYYGG